MKLVWLVTSYTHGFVFLKFGIFPALRVTALEGLFFHLLTGLGWGAGYTVNISFSISALDGNCCCTAEKLRLLWRGEGGANDNPW